MMEDILGSMLENFPNWKVCIGLGLGVLIGVDTLANVFGWAGRTKAKAALAAGPVLALLLHWFEKLDIPVHGEFAPQWWLDDAARHVVGALLFGFIASVAAMAVHDKTPAGRWLDTLSAK